MIVQWLFDWFTDTVAPVVFSTAAPGELSAVLNLFTGGVAWIQSVISPFGVIIPFTTISLMLTLYAAAWGFWMAVALVRVILWFVGR